MKYKITACLRFPSIEGKNKDLRELQTDIESAADIFNSKNTNKKITSIHVFKNIFQFVFDIELDSVSIGHGLSSFSRSLYTTFNWKILSKVPSKLLQYRWEQINDNTNTPEQQIPIRVDNISKTIYISKTMIIDGYKIEFI